ncbi:Concanavalin A-like lectin/glucanases superfamily [Penicillium canescens]|nr:Concanavalin A-like lectin/glucanases superfamily [Penicillium canescens]
MHGSIRFQQQLKADSVILLRASALSRSHLGGTAVVLGLGGSWGEEECIKLDRRFASEEGATTLLHDQGKGFEAIWYELGGEEGTSALLEELEVRTYPSMKALFLQKHEHEEEK